MMASASSAGIVRPVPSDREQRMSIREVKRSEMLQETAAPLVALDGISKQFGTVTAVHALSLEIRRGDFLAILGPSGCGKTTLLRMIGGFIEPSTGAIRMEGRDVTHVGPDQRPSNMVFQGY